MRAKGVQNGGFANVTAGFIGRVKRGNGYVFANTGYEKRGLSFTPTTFFVSGATINVAVATFFVATLYPCPTLDEGTITNNGVDIVRIQWTNDQTNFYFLSETLITTDWNRVPLRPYIWFCVNNDNDTGTGTSFPGVCLESGYDRYIKIEGPSTPSLTVEVFDQNFALIGSGTAATAGTITEVSISLADLGFDGTNCGLAPMGVYMDGRTGDPDDNVTDTGDVPVTCGAPTPTATPLPVTTPTHTATPTFTPVPDNPAFCVIF